MASVIDTLVVALRLDAAHFKKGKSGLEKDLKDSSGQAAVHAKKIAESGKTAAEFFGELRNQAIGLFSAFTAGKGMTEFTRHVMGTDAALGRTAANLGLSAQELAEFRGVAERTGGTAEGITGSFKSLNDQLQQLYTYGTMPALDPLARAGVNTAAFVSRATSAREKILLLADAWAKLSPQNRQLLGRQVGLDEQTINLISRGRKELEALLDEQRRITVVSDEDVKAADALQNSWTRLTQTVEQLGRSVARDLTPPLTDFFDKATTWVHILELLVRLMADLSEEMANASVQVPSFWLDLLPQWLKDFIVIPPPSSSVGHGARGGGARRATPPVQMTPHPERQRQAMAYFVGQGWTPEQAAGIVANLKKESQFDERAIGDDGQAIGIAQWHPDRQRLFEEKFKKKLADATFEEQLAFVDWELKNSEKPAGDALRKQTTRAGAGAVVSRLYARPGLTEADKAQRAQERARAAETISLNAGAGLTAAAASPVTNLSSVTIGTLTVQTQATDARGIADDLGPAIRRQGVAINADRGVRA